MSYLLSRRQVVPTPLEEVFAFFQDPWNLEDLTPPWLNFRILSATDRPVRQGTRIRYRLRVNGVPLGWESLITEYQEGVAFADMMLAGPYRYWHHRHGFRAVPGGTEIADDVTYALPFGPLGRLAHGAMVRRQLEAIFAWREQRVRGRFGARDPAPRA
jgi:ligand-binding SRPBCC domain-containing protein